VQSLWEHRPGDCCLQRYQIHLFLNQGRIRPNPLKIEETCPRLLNRILELKEWGGYGCIHEWSTS
jgi:hypothetical protein